MYYLDVCLSNAENASFCFSSCILKEYTVGRQLQWVATSTFVQKKSNTLCSFLFTIAPVLVINSIKIWEVFYDEFVPHSPRKYIPRSDKDFLDGTFMC